MMVSSVDVCKMWHGILEKPLISIVIAWHHWTIIPENVHRKVLEKRPGLEYSLL